MLRKILAAAVIAALPMSAQAATLTFDAPGTDASSSQTIPLLTYSEAGFTFGLSFGPANQSSGPAIFDTTCSGYSVDCNGDSDLFLSAARQGENGVSGNVLILQSNTDSRTPNDDASAFNRVVFTLLSGPAFRIVGASAIDDVFLGFFPGDTTPLNRADRIGLVGTNRDGGTAIATNFVSPLFQIGDSFTVRYSGSGGLDSIVLAPIPLPAGGLLLLAGLGGLAIARRRTKAA